MNIKQMKKKNKKKERRKEKERDSREFNYNLDSIIFTNFTFFFFSHLASVGAKTGESGLTNPYPVWDLIFQWLLQARRPRAISVQYDHTRENVPRRGVLSIWIKETKR